MAYYTSIKFRHYVGEDLEQLNLRELQNVEQQLETALKRIRTKKVTKINIAFWYVCRQLINRCTFIYTEPTHARVHLRAP